MQDLNKKVVRATKWSVAAEVAAKLVSPIVNMILARLLLPEAFGAVATVTMIISFAEIFTDAGFQKYIVQHEFVDDDDFDKGVNVAFWSNFVMSTVIVIAIWIFRHQLATWVGSPDLGTGIAVASFSIICVAFASIQMAVYRRNLDFKTLFYVRVITTFIPLVITVPLAYFVRNYWALLTGTLVMHIVQAIILTIKSDWKPRLYYSIKRFREMFAFTFWMLLETVAIWLTTYIGTFIVGLKLNDHYLGIYKTSMTTVNAYMAIITSSTYPVLFSALSKVQNDDVEFKKIYFNFQKSVAILLMPMSVGIFMYRDLVVDILLGEKWAEAAGFVGLWGLTSAVGVVLSHFTSAVYQSKGRPKIALFAQVLHLAFLVPTILISCDYGFETLYISRSLIRIQYILTALIISDVVFKIKIKDSIKNILPQTVSAVLMGVVAFLIKDIFPGIVWQFVSVGICVVVYFSILFISPEMRKTVFELDFVKKLLKKIRR